VSGAHHLVTGYLAPSLAGGAHHEAVRVRVAGQAPRVVATYRLGLVDGCLFDGHGVDVRPDHRVPEGDGLIVGYVEAGTVRVEQLDQGVDLTAGRLACYDGCTPFRVSSPGPHRFLVLRVPLPRPRSVDGDAARVLARDLSHLTSTAVLTALLRALLQQPADLAPTVAAHVGDAVSACVRAVVVDALGAPQPGGRRSATFADLARWLEERLADPDLSSQALAEARFLSPRSVRAVFAEHGTTVTTYVRERRLERIRADLLDPHNDATTVASLAARWGLAEPSVFSRAFQRRYGTSPDRFRRLHRAAPTPPEGRLDTNDVTHCEP
jgi:AraC-like DNA-binding protein